MNFLYDNINVQIKDSQPKDTIKLLLINLIRRKKFFFELILINNSPEQNIYFFKCWLRKKLVYTHYIILEKVYILYWCHWWYAIGDMNHQNNRY